MSEREFCAALDALVKSGLNHGLIDSGLRSGNVLTAARDAQSARARVLALYRLRSGEVYEARVGDTHGPGAELDSYVRLPCLLYPHGTKVRVVREGE